LEDQGGRANGESAAHANAWATDRDTNANTDSDAYRDAAADADPHAYCDP